MAPSLPRVIETFQVSPPTKSVPETSIPLTFFDVLWLKFAPVERLFFYPFEHPTSYFTSSCLPLLKSSLSLALRSYFPLAGNLRLAPETTNKYEIHYTDGDSVVFTVAEYDPYDELFGDQPRKMSKLKLLVPPLCKNESDRLWPILAIQVTLFPFHGLVIGTSLLHIACDGSGYVNFMRTWAMICHMMSDYEEIPVQVPVSVELDRSIIPDPDGSIYKTMLAGLSDSTDFNISVAQPDHEKFLTSFQLKQEHIQFLKEVLLHEADIRNVTVRCSSAVVLYAFIWIGYVKAKLSSMSETEETYCMFAIDHRKWFEPPLPDSYFGNCIGPGVVEAKIKDLVGPEGFFVACQAIGKTFDEVKRAGIQDAKNWANITLEIGSKNPFGTAGSLRFQYYDVDFGWGKPSKVDVISIFLSGAMGVAQSKEEQGGVEIELCFTQSEMEVFTNYFKEGLQYMSRLLSI